MRASNLTQAQVPQPKFTFTNQLAAAIKSIQQIDIIQDQIEHKPTISQANLVGNKKDDPNNLVRYFESRDFIIYAIIFWQSKLASNLTLVYFSKSRGQNQLKVIQGIKGKVLCMQFMYPQQFKQQDDQMGEHHYSSIYQTKIVMGNEDGFLKIIDFQDKNQILSFQIDTKAVVDIKVPPPQQFSNHRIVFALVQDNSVYVFSMKSKELVAHFKPNIMMCDAGLSICLHNSMKYFLQSTEGGYLVLWKINQNLYKKLDSEHQMSKSQQKIYNVFPTSILHSASVDGLKWCCFLGDFIALITLKGVFKIIALNVEEKQQFVVILQYQIPNGETIRDAQLFPKEQCLVVAKQLGTIQSVVQCIFFTPELMIRHLLRIRVQSMLAIHGIIISKNYRYVFLRNQQKYFISFTKIIEEKIIQNKKHNDGLRQLQF